MSWLSLRIPARGAEAEVWSDALLEAGALSVSIEDRDVGTDRESAQFGEPGLDEPRVWARNWVEALLPAATDVEALLSGLAFRHGLKPGEYRLEAVSEQDWVRLTQAQFEPIRISDRLWIVPSWHAPPDPDAISIKLDPGLAFGTGSHPTTRLCLRWLEANLKGGESVLDYGCGSGILAIAARRLGAGRVLGVDIDPQAVEAAHTNAARNQVAIEFDLPEAAPWQPVDVLIANILTNPLKMLRPLFAARVRPGGQLVLSGILAGQADELIGLYASDFDLSRWDEDEGWACLVGRRR